MPKITFPRGGDRDLVVNGEVLAIFDDGQGRYSKSLRSDFTLCRCDAGDYVLGLRVALRSASSKSLQEALTFSTAPEAVEFLEQLLGRGSTTVDRCIEMAAFKDESFQALRAARAGHAPRASRRREVRRVLRG